MSWTPPWVSSSDEDHLRKFNEAFNDAVDALRSAGEELFVGDTGRARDKLRKAERRIDAARSEADFLTGNSGDATRAGMIRRLENQLRELRENI